MAPIYLTTLLALAVPVLALHAERRSAAIRSVGSVVVCYGVGILVGNLFPGSIDQTGAVEIGMIAVGLAIPLLLFSIDVVGWFRQARDTVLAFGLCALSVGCVSAAIASIWSPASMAGSELAGMLTAAYIGGNQNMSAVGAALGTSPADFVLLNAADIACGALYLMFLLTLAPRVVGCFLRKTPVQAEGSGGDGGEECAWGLKGAILGVLLASSLCAAGLGVGTLSSKGSKETVVVLAITTLAVLFSRVGAVRRLPGTRQAGQFLLLVFCAAIGSSASLQGMSGSIGPVLGFTASVLFGSVALHLTLCALFGIDRDTALITSTAGVFGPAFVGPVALRLGRPMLFVSGMATAMVGIAAGNYAGLAVAWILR